MTFTADLDRFINAVPGRVEAVRKTAALQVFNEANIPRGAGGNMPVRDGFLRGSGAASLDELPYGPSRSDEAGAVKNPAGNSPAVGAVIASARPDQAIVMGWTMVYARKMEAMYGYAKLSAQKFVGFVNAAAEEMRRRSGS